MSTKIEDWVTHVDTTGDLIYLTSVLPPVNMRLFRTNQSYGDIIRSICRHLSIICMSKMDGYKLPHGVSGANAAIPFNIIAIVRNRATPAAYPEFMLNPKITNTRGITVALSNCGSIRLKEPIKISRHEAVEVEFYDLRGDVQRKWYGSDNGSLTIQHEIDHNNGILITSRRSK